MLLGVRVRVCSHVYKSLIKSRLKSRGECKKLIVHVI